MQVSEIKQRFNQFEQCVEKAMQACQKDANVPPQLADTIKDLDREVHAVHDQVLQARADSDVVSSIDRLEEMGDNAKDACKSASNLSQETQNAVLDMHREISTLKHQLH